MKAQTKQKYTAEHDRRVYDTSRWQRLLFDGRATDGTTLADSVNVIGAALADAMSPALNDHFDDGSFATARVDATDFGGEIYGRLYGEPEQLEQQDAPGWMKRAHGAMDDLEEFEQVRRAVAGDPDFSALAAARMLDVVADKLDDMLEQDRQDEQAAAGEEDGDSDGDAQGNAGPTDRAGLTLNDKLRSAMRSAARTAAKEATEVRAALSGLAPGLGRTPPMAEQTDSARMKLAQQLMSNPELLEILRRAGRIHRISSQHDSRRSDGREDVVGLERGGDVSLMLRHQFRFLRHPKRRLLLMRDIIERRAWQYRMEGSEPLGRGPIVVMLDESSSMNWSDVQGATPHVWARAVGVAMISIAAKQNRPITVIGFDEGVRSCRDLIGQEMQEIGVVGADAVTVARGTDALPKMILDVASTDANGGTSFDEPLLFAMDCGMDQPRADFIFVTDGHASVSEAILTQLQEYKENGLRIYGILVGDGKITPSVEAICDEVVKLNNAADPAKAIGSRVRPGSLA